jgi:hypothetical protein
VVVMGWQTRVTLPRILIGSNRHLTRKFQALLPMIADPLSTSHRILLRELDVDFSSNDPIEESLTTGGALNARLAPCSRWIFSEPLLH